MNTRILAVDRVIAVYNVFLAAAWLRAVNDTNVAWGMVLIHGGAACLPWLLARCSVPSRGIVGILREGYPILVLVAAWAELGWLQEIRQLQPQDAFVQRIDLAFFGVHPHLLWRAAQPQAWLSELMHGFYLSYYLFVFAPPLVLVILGRKTVYRDWITRMLVTYLGCYVLYTLFPVYGPRFGTPIVAAAGSAGWLDHLTGALRAAGDSLGTAFPSSHVAGVVTSAWLSFRWLPRRLAYVFAGGAIAVSLSTVYTQNHYAIDVVAGLTAALVLQIAFHTISTRRWKREPREIHQTQVPRWKAEEDLLRDQDWKGASS